MSTNTTAQAPLLRALRGERTRHRPVWFMRQAGRSLPEYRAVREGTTMLQACAMPELVAEITVQPVRRHGVDAAIFYSDIMVPAKLAGVGVEIVPGTGPVIDEPFRTAADLTRLPELDPAALDPIREGVHATIAMLEDEHLTSDGVRTPLIGFAGAPFTVASYLIEGRPSRDHALTLELMRTDPETWDGLLTWVADATSAFLRAQVESGAQALQLFDSWAGNLSREEYVAHVQKHSARVFSALADVDVPFIHFGTKTGHLLTAMHEAGATAMGVDSDTPLDEASALFGHRVPLQGNIDNALLAGPWDALEAATLDVLRRGQAAPGHVVNLGHGVPPTTDPEVLTRLVSLIHAHADQEASA